MLCALLRKYGIALNQQVVAVRVNVLLLVVVILVGYLADFRYGITTLYCSCWCFMTHALMLIADQMQHPQRDVLSYHSRYTSYLLLLNQILGIHNQHCPCNASMFSDPSWLLLHLIHHPGARSDSLHSSLSV